MGPLTGTFQAQLHWNLHIRAELETCQLGGLWEHAKTVPFLALVSPLWDFGGKQAEPHQSVPVREVLWCV